MLRRKFIKYIAGTPGLLLLGCDSGPDPEPVSNSSYSTPCFSTGQRAYSNGYSYRNASTYANQLIRIAAGLGNISIPLNGAYEFYNFNNAFYMPDSIGYDPNWLSWFNYNTGFQEAGDSIIFHEVGHMWARKNGIGDLIGYGSQQSNWAQEYQADSFAGYILKQLGGNALPSVAIYNIVMSAWSQTHPPGANRAQVFYDSWANNSLQDFSGQSRKGAKESEEGIKNEVDLQLDNSDNSYISELTQLFEIKKEIVSAGVNPYSSESNDIFDSISNSMY